jgi:glycosyltransferase involved in cell wall biosynthesis
MVISFIVPAHNEERLLPRTLRSIQTAAASLGEPFEIVVADDGSTDRTGESALRFGARVVRIEARQIAAARNAGARASRGDLLIFIDADTSIDERVLKAVVDSIQSGAVGGGAIIGFDGFIPRRLRGAVAVFVRVYFHLKLAAGCFLYCTRAAYKKTGGFDERLFAAEETAMSAALKRLGRFVVLRERVLTSGRKLRTYTAKEILWALARACRGGGRGLLSRDGLEIWYERRPDPEGGQREVTSCGARPPSTPSTPLEPSAIPGTPTGSNGEL